MSALRICPMSASRSVPTSIRMPPAKSIPKLRPRPSRTATENTASTMETMKNVRRSRRNGIFVLSGMSRKRHMIRT